MNILFKIFTILFAILFSSLAISSDKNNSAVFQIIQNQMIFNNSTVESAVMTRTTDGNYGVILKLKANAAKKLSNLTEENIGKQANIMLNSKVISSTMIHSKLGGEFTITGLTKQQANQFIKNLDLKSE